MRKNNYRELEALLRGAQPFSMNHLIGGTGLDGVIRQMKNDVTTSLIQTIVNKLGYTVRFSRRGEDGVSGNDNFTKAYQWIRKYDKMFDVHVDNPQDIDKEGDLTMIKMSDRSFLIVIEPLAYALVRTGRYVPNARYDSNDMEIYITGKHAKPYFDELSNMTKSRANESVLQHYRVEGSDAGVYYTYVSNLRTRNIDTLFYEKGIKENIISHINNFINSEELYKSRDLIYKTGILLTGEPGTGKTSLVTALATYFKWNLITINMEKFKYVNAQELADSITADPTRYIILMEDIDITLNNDANSDEKDYQECVHKLMQFLDGNISPSGVIIIATTNHPERLDKRILRDGRFDITIYVDELGYDGIIEMAKSFDLTDESVESVIETLVKEAIEKDVKDGKDMSKIDMEEYRKNLKVNQAHIQTVILQSMKKQINLVPEDIEEQMGELSIDFNKPETENNVEGSKDDKKEKSSKDSDDSFDDDYEDEDDE